MKYFNQIIKINFFLLIFPCLFSFFSLTQYLPYYNPEKLIYYQGEIPHFFTHEIIGNAKLAFDPNNILSNHYDKDCITHKEFQNFLQTMYDKHYMLVDIYSIIGFDKNGECFQKKLYFPKDKKPLLLSFDDMTYDTKNKGLCDRIILTKNNEIASYTKANTPQIEYDKDNLPILEQFINQHPDFSYKNARAIICPTGYNGILGYRINHSNPNYKDEIQKLAPLVSRLKDLRYHFASHTYNHIQINCTNDFDIEKDLKQYNYEITSVFGTTDILCFPCGARTNSIEKINIMKKYGYKIFLCIGIKPSIQVKNKCVFLDRKVLDGHSLRCFRKEYIKYFDTFTIYDNEARHYKI